MVEPQPIINPMLFFALIPTVLFVGFAIVFVRWRPIVNGLYQRWVKDKYQRYIDKQ